MGGVWWDDVLESGNTSAMIKAGAQAWAAEEGMRWCQTAATVPSQLTSKFSDRTIKHI